MITYLLTYYYIIIIINIVLEICAVHVVQSAVHGRGVIFEFWTCVTADCTPQVTRKLRHEPLLPPERS